MRREILLVNSLDRRYGSTYRARRLFAAFLALGYRCRYVESNSDLSGKDIIYIRQRDDMLGYLVASLRRAVIVLRERSSIIIVQKITPLTFFAIIAAFLRNEPLVIDWDDLDAEFQLTKARAWIIKTLEFFVPRLCSLVTTHSKIIADYAAKRGAKRISYLPQVVDTHLFNPARFNKNKEKQAIGLADKRVIGYAGTFTEGGMRDFDVILSFFKEKCRSDNYHFLVVGGGPLQKNFEALLESRYEIENYTITGLVAHEQMPHYIVAMDACLIYMRDDMGNRARVSLKLLEYLAMEKPVFGKVVGETKDILGGYLLGFSDFTDERFEESMNHQTSMLREARTTVEHNFSIEALERLLGEIGLFKDTLLK